MFVERNRFYPRQIQCVRGTDSHVWQAQAYQIRSEHTLEPRIPELPAGFQQKSAEISRVELRRAQPGDWEGQAGGKDISVVQVLLDPTTAKAEWLWMLS